MLKYFTPAANCTTAQIKCIRHDDEFKPQCWMAGNGTFKLWNWCTIQVLVGLADKKNICWVSIKNNGYWKVAIKKNLIKDLLPFF